MVQADVGATCRPPGTKLDHVVGMTTARPRGPVEDDAGLHWMASAIRELGASRSFGDLAATAASVTAHIVESRAVVVLIRLHPNGVRVVSSSAGPMEPADALLCLFHDGQWGAPSMPLPAAWLGLAPADPPVCWIDAVPLDDSRGTEGCVLLTELPDGSPPGTRARAQAGLVAAAVGAMLNHLHPGVETSAFEEGARCERRRITMELHDNAIQSLYAAGLSLEAAARCDSTPGPAREPLRRSRATIDRAIDDLRGYIDMLERRDPTVPELGAGLDALAAEAAAAGIAVTVEVATCEPVCLPDGPRRELLLLAREAVSNASRHAHAAHVLVHLAVDARTVHLVIQDDGVGFDPLDASPGLGMRTMEDRAAALRGRLEITSAPGQGTRVVFEGPMRWLPIVRRAEMPA